MPSFEPTEVATCRLILIRPGSGHLQAELLGDRLCLPRVAIWRRRRIARQLQLEVERVWHLKAVVLDVFDTDLCATCFAVLEILSGEAGTGLTCCPVHALAPGEIPRAEKEILSGILDGASGALGPFARPGWIGEALHWIEEATSTRFGNSVEITQLNGSARFALLRLAQPGGKVIWLKAVGGSNAQEFSITRVLAALCPQFLPRRIAAREDWKAWLMDDAGTTPDPWTSAAALEAARVMASVQRHTLGRREELIAAGAFDWRIETLGGNLGLLAEKAETWMRRQCSQKDAPVRKIRLPLLMEILRDACRRMEALSIPDAVLHGDTSQANVLLAGDRCVFTDWCEVGVGNPFLALPFLERLCSSADLSAIPRLRDGYKDFWSDILTGEQIACASVLAPLLTPLLCLFGRRGWRNGPDDQNPELDRYRCGLIRRIDRVAHDTEVMEVLYS